MSYLLALMMLLLCTGALVDAAENKRGESNDEETYEHRIYAFKAQTNAKLLKFAKNKVELPSLTPSKLIEALDNNNGAVFKELSEKQKAAIALSLLDAPHNLILIDAKPEATVKQTEEGPVLIYGFVFGGDDSKDSEISEALGKEFSPHKFKIQKTFHFTRPAPRRFDHVRIFFSNVQRKVKIRTDPGFLFPAGLQELTLYHKYEPHRKGLSSYGEFDDWLIDIDEKEDAQRNSVPDYEPKLEVWSNFDRLKYYNDAMFSKARWKYSDWKAGDKVTLVVNDDNGNFITFATVELSDEDLEDYSVSPITQVYNSQSLVDGFIREIPGSSDVPRESDILDLVSRSYLQDDHIHTKLVYEYDRSNAGEPTVGYFSFPWKQIPSEAYRIEFVEAQLSRKDLSSYKAAKIFVDRAHSAAKHTISRPLMQSNKNLRIDVTKKVFDSWSWDGSVPITVFFYKAGDRIFKYARIKMETNEMMKTFKAKKEEKEQKRIKKLEEVKAKKERKRLKELKWAKSKYSLANRPPSKPRSIATDLDKDLPPGGGEQPPLHELVSRGPMPPKPVVFSKSGSKVQSKPSLASSSKTAKTAVQRSRVDPLEKKKPAQHRLKKQKPSPAASKVKLGADKPKTKPYS
eukprot:876960_1